MSDLDLADDIAAFHAQRPRLLQKYGPRWVVMVDQTFEGAFDEFEQAATFALEKFSDRPFLIRHTEEHEPHIPLVVVEAV